MRINRCVLNMLALKNKSVKNQSVYILHLVPAHYNTTYFMTSSGIFTNLKCIKHCGTTAGACLPLLMSSVPVGSYIFPRHIAV